MEDEINNKRIKMAIISGAAHALSYKQKSPKTHDDQIIQQITSEAEEILKKIDEEL